jgi:hypothetical protein
VPDFTIADQEYCPNTSVSIDPIADNLEFPGLIYDWNPGSESESLATFNTEGNYSLTVTNECGDSSGPIAFYVNLIQPNEPCDDGDTLTNNDQYNDACECAGVVTTINELTNSFTFYPNPASDYIRIESLNHISIKRLLVYNAIGQSIIDQQFESAKADVDVRALSSGLYTIVIVGKGEEIQVVKFTKL